MHFFMRTQAHPVLIEGAVGEVLALEGPDSYDCLGCGGHVLRFNQGPIVFRLMVSDFLDNCLDEVDGIILLHYLFVREYLIQCHC